MRCTKCRDKNFLIECKCGCAQILTRKSEWWDMREYIKGHGRTGRKYREVGLKIRGENNPNWRGGRVINSEGYIFIRSEGHSRARRKGQYVPEHVVVMERHLGRFLTNDEVVHHINGIKTDNRIENLELMTWSSHGSHHMQEKIRSGTYINPKTKQLFNPRSLHVSFSS
jgi:hypothetical protein